MPNSIPLLFLACAIKSQAVRVENSDEGEGNVDNAKYGMVSVESVRSPHHSGHKEEEIREGVHIVGEGLEYALHGTEALAGIGAGVGMKAGFKVYEMGLKHAEWRMSLEHLHGQAKQIAAKAGELKLLFYGLIGTIAEALKGNESSTVWCDTVGWGLLNKPPVTWFTSYQVMSHIDYENAEKMNRCHVGKWPVPHQEEISAEDSDWLSYNCLYGCDFPLFPDVHNVWERYLGYDHETSMKKGILTNSKFNINTHKFFRKTKSEIDLLKKETNASRQLELFLSFQEDPTYTLHTQSFLTDLHTCLCKKEHMLHKTWCMDAEDWENLGDRIADLHGPYDKVQIARWRKNRRYRNKRTPDDIFDAATCYGRSLTLKKTQRAVWTKLGKVGGGFVDGTRHTKFECDQIAATL